MLAGSSLEAFRVTIENVPERVDWAAGLNVLLPSSIVLQLSRDRQAALSDLFAQRTAQAVARDLRECAAYTPHPPVSGRLKFSYRTIPPRARRLLAGILGRIQRMRQASWSRYPGWPLDLSADFVADLSGQPGHKFAHTPVLLTHDIDSPEGLENLVKYFLPIEEALGARSANYIVPCAWALDKTRLEETISRGHEIGIHGYDHANRTPFFDTFERRRRLTAGHKIGRNYGAIGYRSPSLLRTRGLLQDLSSYYRYDSSIPTSGGPFPTPNQGCASARPWKIGPLWEIPVTLPRDGSLRFLGYSPAQIAKLWQSTAERIARSGGLICILTHCEAGVSGNAGMLAAYQWFLEWAAQQSQFRFVKPADLVTELEPTGNPIIEPAS